jgi:hypothetical protein
MPHLTRNLHRPALLAILATTGALMAAPAHAAPPGNDDLDDAVVVPGVPYTDTVDTTEATYVEGDSDCGIATVWYTFTPETDGTYVFDTIGSDFDTTLAVSEGSPGDLSLLACNDDFFGLQSGVVIDLEQGTTYYIEAGTCCSGDVDQVGPGGTLVFNVGYPPDALDVELTIDPVVTLGVERGTATLTGTVTCSNEGSGYVTGTLRQRQGLNIARGDFYVEFTCGPTPTTWSTTVDTGNRALVPKRAQVEAYAGACDGFTCDEATVSSTVRVRR